jgi:hypothetical protein
MKRIFVCLVLACMVPFVAQANEPRHVEYSETHDFGSLADAAGETGSLTAPGVALGDYCSAISLGVSLAGMTLTCYVSAANTVSYRLQNESGGVLDLASTTVYVLVRKRA